MPSNPDRRHRGAVEASSSMHDRPHDRSTGRPRAAEWGRCRGLSGSRSESQEPAAEQAPRTLWRHRNFLLLWSGQTVSEVGSAVTQLALPLTAVVVLRASTFQVGLLTSATTAAFALIALPAGALVDRRPKRRIMIWCDAARVLIIGSVPLAAALGVLTLGQLYAVALTAGVCTVFFDVSYQSYLPGLVEGTAGGRQRQAGRNPVVGTGHRAEPGRRPGRARRRGPCDGRGRDLLRRLGAVPAGHPRPGRTTAQAGPAQAERPRSPRGSRSCCGTRSCARSRRALEPRTCSAA